MVQRARRTSAWGDDGNADRHGDDDIDDDDEPEEEVEEGEADDDMNL